MTTKLRFRRVPATLMRRTSSRWPSRRSGLDRTKGFSDLSWPVAKYWAIERILACGLCLVLTFCKFSQFQFGWLQYLLSQIDYKFVGPSSLMSLCVWPFQTTVRFCEADYYCYVYGRSKPLYAFAKLIPLWMAVPNHSTLLRSLYHYHLYTICHYYLYTIYTILLLIYIYYIYYTLIYYTLIYYIPSYGFTRFPKEFELP